MQKPANSRSSTSSTLDMPGDFAEGPDGEAQVLGGEFRQAVSASRRSRCPTQRFSAAGDARG